MVGMADDKVQPAHIFGIRLDRGEAGGYDAAALEDGVRPFAPLRSLEVGIKSFDAPIGKSPCSSSATQAFSSHGW